jgi:hypothetical protein
MPIYLVRWPDLSASLVRARDEEDLVAILDQVGNADGCEWSVYEGPLFIDFRLPVQWSIRDDRPEQPILPEQVVVGDIGAMAREDLVGTVEVSLADGDDGYATGEEVVRLAFPELQAVVDTFRESADTDEIDRALPEAELRGALQAELGRALRSSWRRAQLQKKQDPVSALAREMDLPMALARKYVDAALAPTTDQDEGVEAELDEAVMPGLLFNVSNHHTAACGEPPAVDADVSHAYHGYFANEYGEQAIYAYDHATGEATVRIGDAGWDNVYRVVDGRIEGVKVTNAEATWLRACWAATGAIKHGPPPGADKRAGRARYSRSR